MSTSARQAVNRVTPTKPLRGVQPALCQDGWGGEKGPPHDTLQLPAFTDHWNDTNSQLHAESFVEANLLDAK